MTFKYDSTISFNQQPPRGRSLSSPMGWLFVVLTMMVGGGGLAREWSDEVRMTYAEENLLYYDGAMEMDANDVIHVFCGIMRCQDEDYNEAQPIYQKFNNHGEPLSDPLLIEDIVDLPDSVRFRAYDLFIDNNGNIYLLWGEVMDGEEDGHITVFDDNVEIVSGDIVLRGVSTCSLDSKPDIAVDSQGNIIYAGELYDHNNHVSRIFYARYTPEGEMIDTVHIIADNWARDFSLEIDSEDNLHIVWKVNGNNQHYSVHYTKVSPDDELLIDNYSLPSIIGREDELHFNGFSLDKTGSPLFLLDDGEDYVYGTYLMKLNDDLDICFNTYLGLNANYSLGYLYVDKYGNIHAIASFDDDELDHGLRFIGYVELDENGEIIDSLQVIHDASMRGEERRSALWSWIFVFASEDSAVSVIWADGRHDTGHEYYMRYSKNDNHIIDPSQDNPPSSIFLLSPNYPNPFNSLTNIPFYTQITGEYILNIFDIQGRLVYSDRIAVQKPGGNIFYWQGLDCCGKLVPSGTYLAVIESTSFNGSQKIFFLR